MKKEVSALGHVNLREAGIGLLIAIAAALIDLLWTGFNPVIVEWNTNKILDFALFTSKVNFTTAWQTASMTSVAYFMLIVSSGQKKKQ